MSRSRVVHFATHGFSMRAYPQLSGLALSQSTVRGSDKDGLLRAYEIDDLKLDADLVVLSACQRALGKDVRGEGLVGLAQAFLAGGSSAVLVSLWEVDDRATAELMGQFYRYLVDGLPPAAALKMAQTRMIEREAWRSPFYWAGFVLEGEWKEVEGVPAGTPKRSINKHQSIVSSRDGNARRAADRGGRRRVAFLASGRASSYQCLLARRSIWTRVRRNRSSVLAPKTPIRPRCVSREDPTEAGTR